MMVFADIPIAKPIRAYKMVFFADCTPSGLPTDVTYLKPPHTTNKMLSKAIITETVLSTFSKVLLKSTFGKP